MENEIKEMIAQLKVEAQEALSTVRSYAEKAEKIDKLEERVNEVFDKIKEFSERKGMYSAMPAMAGVEELTRKKGVATISDIRTSIFGKRLSDDARDVIETHDLVYIAHQIATAKG